MVSSGISQLLSQGLLGVIVIFLLWYIGKLQTELRDLRETHKVEIAAERKLNAELQDERLVEAKSVLEVIVQVKSTLDAWRDSRTQGGK